jgi:hypothetical protein
MVRLALGIVGALWPVDFFLLALSATWLPRAAGVASLLIAVATFVVPGFLRVPGRGLTAARIVVQPL